MWPDCQNDPTGLAILQWCKDHPLETDRRMILADWLEDQDEAEVAECLRRSIIAGETWLAFSASASGRWFPLSGCWQGWFATQCDPTELPDSPWCRVWRRRRPYLKPGDEDALSESPALAHLEFIDLDGNQIRDAGLMALSRSLHLAQVMTLDLRSTGIGNAGVIALAAARYLNRLTVLRLADNHIETAGAEALARSRILEGVVSLDLSGTRITEVGIAALAESSHLNQLRELNLRSVSISRARNRRALRAIQVLRRRGVSIYAEMY